MNLYKNTKIVNALAAQTESTAINSTIVDCQGFDGVYFIARGSTTFAGASITMTGQMSTANSTAALTAMQDTVSSTKMVAGTDYRVIALDCHNLTERYARARVTGSSSGYLTSIIAVLYQGRRPGSSAMGAASTTVANVGHTVASTS